MWTRHVLTLIAFALGFFIPTEASDDLMAQCVRAAPRLFSGDETVRLCKYATLGLDDGPAICASAVLRNGATVFADKNDSVRYTIELCEKALDSGPADCWASVSTQMRRSKEWRGPIVAVCKQAKDAVPAQCLVEYKHHGLSTTSRKRTEMDLATTICSTFHGDAIAIGACLARAPRSMPDVSRFALCRRGRVNTVPDVVKCAKQLVQRNVRAAVVARVCASAEPSASRPEACVLAAQQQLRWMDSDAVSDLCEYSLVTAAPVHCAVALRSWFVGHFTKEQPLVDLARLCRRAKDHELIVKCAKKVPGRLFDAKQVVRLCAAEEHGVASLMKIECVVAARQQLFGLRYRVPMEYADRDREEQAALLIALCDNVTSSAPLDCLSSTALQSPPFTPSQRIRLCQEASTNAPFHCYRNIHTSVQARFPSPVQDAIELCREATSLAPAGCVNQLHDAPAAFFQAGFATWLCQHASSAAPATCFLAAPFDFSNEDKVMLCRHAESDEPAKCARVSLPRIRDHAMKVELCAKAKSIAPTKCASSSPYGMRVEDIVALCRFASNDKPSECAQTVPLHLRVPWSDIAAVCQGSRTLTPGRCIAHRVRLRVPITQRVISECRSMESPPTTIEIVDFAYECAELVPKCAVTARVRALDQFGDEATSLSHGHVHFIVIAEHDGHKNEALVGGLTIAPFINGTATFRSLRFTFAGNFTLRLTSPGMEDMVARVHVRVNETEQRERQLCERMFSLMQCELVQPSRSNSPGHDAGRLQLLVLPSKHVFVGVECESVWAVQHGLKPVGRTVSGRLYALPYMAYQLLTGLDIPTSAMNSWARLGIPEGSNRSTIRRAYHKRALDWHPDKWIIGTSSVSLRAKVDVIYSLINSAYEQLFYDT